jgi:hypothetical protein
MKLSSKKEMAYLQQEAEKALPCEMGAETLMHDITPTIPDVDL